MKKFLVFTGIGNDDQFKSWATEKSEIFDRALNCWQSDQSRLEEIQSYSPEFFLNQTGEIWSVFLNNYEKFKDYDYVLLADSDLVLDRNQLENTFLMAEKNDWPACQWSRDPNTFCGNPKRVKQWFTKGSGIRETNFIEMIFMLIRKDLLELLIKKWKEFDLEFAYGVDIILSNVARENNLLPFYLIDDYYFYNPHPDEKIGNVRQIDTALGNKEKNRGKLFNNLVAEQKDFIQIRWSSAYVK